MITSQPYEPLLTLVAERLASTGTTSDHLLLTRWRVLSLCQYLLGSPSGEAERVTVEALRTFARDGTCASSDSVLLGAAEAIARENPTAGGSVLPSIAPAKREEVLTQLRTYERLGIETVDRALRALPSLRDRLRQPPAGTWLAGIRHRLELVAAVVADAARSDSVRCRAAAAILYVDELHDAIPDSLGHIGLLDDDFALRVVLEELGEHSEGETLHWAERISALWDDLPFLRGVHLNRDGGPVATTWLDRINSYIAYGHAIDRQAKPLVLVQPSVACSPLHSIVSLIGLLVLDGVTTSGDLIKSLRVGQVYEIDGKYFARFDGISGPPTPGWLRLGFRPELLRGRRYDPTVLWPPSIAARMIPSTEQHLSSARTFPAHVRSHDAEPIQRFFAWDQAIGAASISSRVILVTTRQRAIELFEGVKSNGVSLLDDGLVRFAGLSPSADTLRGGLVLVVPNLTVARRLLDQGVGVYAIVVDGYERLHRGRHDLPFLMRRPLPPPVIVWSPTGYYPIDPPPWLPEHRRLEVSSEDLSYILELDGEIDDSLTSSCASLWEAATASLVRKVLVEPSAEEQELLGAIESLIGEIRQSSSLPDYWQYHLLSSVTMLQSLATATPSRWSDIREIARSWKVAFDQQWTTLKPRAAKALEPLARSHRRIMEILQSISTERNTKADALVAFLGRGPDEEWRLVCDRPEQVRVVGRLVREVGASGVEPALLRDLGVCRPCIVVGWRSMSFGRRLLAHTPRRLVALVGEGEGICWDRVCRQSRERIGDSLLEAVGHQPSSPGRSRELGAGDPISLPATLEDQPEPTETDQSVVPCVFIWLADEPEGKILARDARILMEIGGQAKEGPAHRTKPEDRVILGPGSTRWSPAEEFTEAVVEAVEASHPELVREAKEWRRALQRLREGRGWSLDTLRSKLAEVGVARGIQTLDGWLRLDRASPIGPRHIHEELKAIWGLLEGQYSPISVAPVAAACSRLRALRAAAGRALLKLWRGGTVDVGVDEAWLGELVERLRQEVQVHEVDAVTYGNVPEAMLGWWITPELAATFEESGSQPVPNSSEEISEDD